MKYICKYTIDNNQGDPLRKTSDIIIADNSYLSKVKLQTIEPLAYNIRTFLTVETDNTNSQFINELRDLFELMVARDCRNERYVLEFSEKWAEKLEIE